MRFRETALGLLVPCEPRCYFDAAPRGGGLFGGVNSNFGGGLPSWLSQFGGGGGAPGPSSPVFEGLKSGYRESDATTPEDGEENTDWINSGTNGSDLTQAGAAPASPIYHTPDVGGTGTDGILFDGTMWMYNTSFATTNWGAMTWYCGAALASPPAGLETLLHQETSGGVLVARLYISISGDIRFQYRVGSTTYNAYTTSTPFSGPSGFFASIIATRDASDGQMAIWYNGTKLALTTDTKAAGTTVTGDRLSLCSDATGSASNAWVGFMTECGMYDRKLTDAQVGALHTALALGF